MAASTLHAIERSRWNREADAAWLERIGNSVPMFRNPVADFRPGIDSRGSRVCVAVPFDLALSLLCNGQRMSDPETRTCTSSARSKSHGRQVICRQSEPSDH